MLPAEWSKCVESNLQTSTTFNRSTVSYFLYYVSLNYNKSANYTHSTRNSLLCRSQPSTRFCRTDIGILGRDPGFRSLPVTQNTSYPSPASQAKSWPCLPCFHGIWWLTMNYHGCPSDTITHHGQMTMVDHGHWLFNYGQPWLIMKYHVQTWNTMVKHEIPWLIIIYHVRPW